MASLIARSLFSRPNWPSIATTRRRRASWTSPIRSGEGRDGGSTWASLELARVYEQQGRVDRALRAVRRRWIAMGEPDPAGLAESYRLEGRLAVLADDKVGAMRAYRNYLRLRVDPEPSRIPQLDSVRAELRALGDLKAGS